jgi:hypothetical protein
MREDAMLVRNSSLSLGEMGTDISLGADTPAHARTAAAVKAGLAASLCGVALRGVVGALSGGTAANLVQ